MSRCHRLFRPLLLIAVLLLTSSPAWAYIVYLKDGAEILTKEKYSIDGDKVILILPSGVRASYDASLIDFERTEESNKGVNYGGTTKVVQEKDERLMGITEEVVEEKEPTFGEYISGRGLALPEASRRQVQAENTLPLTHAGFVDLLAMPRVPYPHDEITADVLGYLRGQGIDQVRIFKGTASDRPLLEVVAPSEASVFKVLQDTASGLVQIHERFPQKVAAFELVMITDAQVRAAQFVLTPEMAQLLVSKRLSAPNFFLRYVEF